MKSYCIYKHTSPNGKVYIGQTCKNTNTRWSNGYGYRNQSYFWRAIQKHGWDNFKHEILLEGLSKEDADKKEIEMISVFNSANPKYGYNISLGGSGSIGVKHSEKTKQKISNAKKGKIRSEESKLRQSETMRGHICSEDTKRKIGEANSKRVWSEKSKEKLRKKNLGKTMSEETKQKISKTLKGRIISEKNREITIKNNKERIWTEESKRKISEANKGRPAPNRKRVICIENDTVFESAYNASLFYNISRSAISRACKNSKRTAGGYHWQFFNSDANLNR